MAAKFQRPKEWESVFSSLNKAIDALNLVDVSNITPAKVAFDSTRNLLTTIRVGSLPLHVGRLLANVYRIR